MFIFSARVFSAGLITCSMYTPKYMHHNESDDDCDYYKMADHDFISKYCYGNLADYNVSSTGEVDMESKTKLNYLKLFAYVLFGLSAGGGLPKLYWTITENKRSTRASYLIDGIEEAMADLLITLKDIGMKNYDRIKQEIKLENVENIGEIKAKAKQENLNINEMKASSIYKDEKPGPEKAQNDQNGKSQKVAPKRTTRNLGSFEMESADKAKKIQKMLDSEWKKKEISSKYIELNKVIKARAESRELFYIILFGRFLSIACNIIGGSVIGWYYAWDHNEHDHKSFNCLLPEAYWYFDDQGNEWKTTSCYILSAGAFNLVCKILFGMYCVLFFLQFLLWYRNYKDMKSEYEMIRYMPITADSVLAKKSISDLHVLLGLVNENNYQRLTIQAGEKVLNGLDSKEQYKLLPVLMESIIWSATETKIEELVERMIERSNPNTKKNK